MAKVLLRKYATAMPSMLHAKIVIKITVNALKIMTLYVLKRLKKVKERTKKRIKHEYLKKLINESKKASLIKKEYEKNKSSSMLKRSSIFSQIMSKALLFLELVLLNRKILVTSPSLNGKNKLIKLPI